MENTEVSRHEVVVDTKIAEAYEVWMRKQGAVASAVTSTKYAAGFRSPASRDGRWTRRVNGVVEYATLDDAIEVLETKGDERLLSYGKTAAEVLTDLTAAHEAADEAQQAYYEANLDYEGWSRFFLVPGGHIHSSMNCSTCNHRGRATSFGWLPELSGLSESEAVAEHGPVLCTVCYPSAPVEWTVGQLNAKGEYVAPKTYCPGSNGRPVEGTVRRSYRSAYARCPECGEMVTYGNNGLRKHQPPKS